MAAVVDETFCRPHGPHREMIFHSLGYLGFFLAVWAIYWCLPRRGQGALLIMASLYFYGCVHLWFLIPFAVTMLVDFSVGVAIEKLPRHKKLLLGVSVFSNLTLLGFFKYWDFFATNVNEVLAHVGLDLPLPLLQVVLPVGISFYTFQSLGYVIDVYRGELAACRRLDDFSVFVSFFPQLVAGPIDRHGRLLKQVQVERRFDFTALPSIFTLAIWGYFKKLVIADNCGLLADKVFAHAAPAPLLLLAGVLAFTVQIFADFSAYTDIARASARLLGFELIQNFNHPWLSQSPADFWRRWHISLSSWFRDYVYIPLGGSRSGLARQLLNILITFFISGLWHGAAWNFILWGLYWGALIAIERVWNARRMPGIPSLVSVPVTFVLSVFGWMLFREHDLGYLASHFTGFGVTVPPARQAAALHLVAQVVIYSLPIWLHGAWDAFASRVTVPATARFWLQTVVSALLLAAIMVLRSERTGDFIYFQF